MEKTVDARGLACPRPVMLTKKALKGADVVTCIVDNATARDNVSRLAANEGCQVSVEEKDGAFYVRLSRSAEGPGAKGQGSGEAAASRQPITCPATPATSTVMMIGSETLGRGSEELGGILTRGLFHTLAEGDRKPNALIFINSGVKLVANGSPVADDLRALEEQGVQVLACGTCLGYYELKDKVAVGQISNMYSIVEMMLDADKVSSL
jgi:selenium metabolism protein YedF